MLKAYGARPFVMSMRSAPLRAFVEFFAHVFEEIRLRFGRILANHTGLRQSERGKTMRRGEALVVHPGDKFPAVSALAVAELMIITNERSVISRPLEL